MKILMKYPGFSLNKGTSGVLFSLCFLFTLLAVSPGALAETISLNSPSYSVNEDTGAVSVDVTLQPDQSGGFCFEECYQAIRIDYATSDSTASAGSDYSSASGTITWTGTFAGPDAPTQSIPLSITPDSLIEPDETFNFSITNCEEIDSSGIATPCSFTSLISPTTAVVTILNDDNAGTVSLDNASYSVNENAGNVTVTASRTGGISGDVAVSYSTANSSAQFGQDYTSATGLLSWADGESGAKSVVIPIINDSIVEPTENFSILLSNPSASLALGQSSAVITVVDDDNAGTVGLDSPTYSVNEKGASLTITATRTGGTSNTVSVQYNTSNGSAVSGQDYTATAGVLSWADGEAG